MSPNVRPTIAADLPLVANAMRVEDVAEVKASSGSTPLEALTRGFQNSPYCCTFIPDRTPAAIFGVSPHPDHPTVGVGWLLGTDEIITHRRQFIAGTSAHLAEAGRGYSLLMNYVDERNTVHIRWLRWCGFTFIARHLQHGVEGRSFLEFVRLTHV